MIVALPRQVISFLFVCFEGRIVNVTSVKGRIAVPHDVGYCVTKYATEAFSDILRREMHKFGINVSVIEPGYFDGATGMLTKEYVRMYANIDIR